MEAIKTTAELESDKAVFETELAQLTTKEGADAFIASKIAVLDEILSKLPDKPSSVKGRLSMKAFLEHLKALHQTEPALVVQRQIALTEQKVVQLDQELLQVKDAVEPVEFGEVKR